jgi:hypothetical protein
MRVTIKQLEERIKTINGLTNNKYELKLHTTTGCGVDISINGEYQADNLNRLFTNKEAMELLDKKFSKEIRQIIMGL